MSRIETHKIVSTAVSKSSSHDILAVRFVHGKNYVQAIRVKKQGLVMLDQDFMACSTSTKTTLCN